MALLEFLAFVEHVHVRLLAFWPVMLAAMLVPPLLLEQEQCEAPLCGHLWWAHVTLMFSIVMESGTCYTRIRGVPSEFLVLCEYQVDLFLVCTVTKAVCVAALLIGHAMAHCWTSAALYFDILCHTFCIAVIYGLVYPRMSTADRDKFRRCRRFLELLPLPALTSESHSD